VPLILAGTKGHDVTVACPSFRLVSCTSELNPRYVESIVENKKHLVCEKMTYQWVFYEKYYYTDTPETCRKLVAERGK
jgi:hypothetical protein